MSRKDGIELVIVSGISGSGKSTALNAYEDVGFFCLDNLPAPLVEHFVNLLISELSSAQKETTSDAENPPSDRRNRYALLVDCRDAVSVELIRRAMVRLSDAGVTVSLLFLECQEEVVATRFRQTRRPHPMLQGSSIVKTIAEALERERELLADLRVAADRIIDTSNYSPHELRRRIEDDARHTNSLKLHILSFGFKYGVPHDIDLLIDVRFLPNPHFVEELRPLRGVDKKIQDYVFTGSDADEFLSKYMALLEFLIPKYQEEGKRYLTLAIGCTGGKHRSVALGERFSEILQSKKLDISLTHRDIERV